MADRLYCDFGEATPPSCGGPHASGEIRLTMRNGTTGGRRFRGYHRLEVRALHPRAEHSRDSTTDSPDLEVYVARQARTPTKARRSLFLSTHPHET